MSVAKKHVSSDENEMCLILTNQIFERWILLQLCINIAFQSYLHKHIDFEVANQILHDYCIIIKTSVLYEHKRKLY